MKKLKITVFPDGYVQAETVGIKGKKCEEYFPFFEKLLQGRVVEKIHTEEFYQETEQEQKIYGEEEIVINASSSN